MDQLLRSKRIIICLGCGGVGKTTLAAGLAVRAARLGLKTLVLTIDPSKRLATSLGMELNDQSQGSVHFVQGVLQDLSEASKVNISSPGPGQLFAGIVDPKSTFDRFVRQVVRDENLYHKVVSNSLYRQLITRLNGSQEFTSLQRLYECYSSNEYDLIILDTPPVEHTVDFLMAPQKIESIFQKSVSRWFIFWGQKKKNWVARALGQMTMKAFEILEKLTGSIFITELIDFFVSIESWQHNIKDRAEDVRCLLASQKVAFVMVTTYSTAQLTEALRIQKELSDLGYHLSAVLINKVVPLWPELVSVDNVTDKQLFEPFLNLVRYYNQYRNYWLQRDSIVHQMEGGVTGDLKFLRIPQKQHEVVGINELIGLSDCIKTP